MRGTLGVSGGYGRGHGEMLGQHTGYGSEGPVEGLLVASWGGVEMWGKGSRGKEVGGGMRQAPQRNAISWLRSYSPRVSSASIGENSTPGIADVGGTGKGEYMARFVGTREAGNVFARAGQIRLFSPKAYTMQLGRRRTRTENRV